MLYLVSIGLYNEKDLSLRALEAIKKCSKVYAEFYTSPIKVNINLSFDSFLLPYQSFCANTIVW